MDKPRDPWRPSDYNDSMPQRAYEAMASGGGMAGVAVACGIVKSTVSEWANKYKDFSDAINMGRAISEMEWSDPNFHPEMFAARYSLNMRNRFGWSEKIETAHTGANGGPIEHAVTIAINDDQAKKMAKEFLLGAD